MIDSISSSAHLQLTFGTFFFSSISDQIFIRSRIISSFLESMMSRLVLLSLIFSVTSIIGIVQKDKLWWYVSFCHRFSLFDDDLIFKGISDWNNSRKIFSRLILLLIRHLNMKFKKIHHIIVNQH